MKYAAFRQLETPRLLLRELCMEDAEAFFSRLGGSPEVTKHMLWVPHRDISETYASIQKALNRYASGTGYRWAITLRHDAALIGIIDLLGFDEHAGNCSFAYMLGKDHWNRGFATEALEAVFRFAFTEMDMETITADHFAENPASGAVMAKVGMRRLETIPEKYEKDGSRHDAVVYRITRAQWQQIHTK